jgi:hypothetical protein
MDEKKRKKEISERARREAAESPTVRRLRELVARGEAELSARRADGEDRR